MAKNICNKVRPQKNPYEIWRLPNGWIYHVLRKYQADDAKPYARWLCNVEGDYNETGDVYANEIMEHGTCVYQDPTIFGKPHPELEHIPITDLPVMVGALDRVWYNDGLVYGADENGNGVDTPAVGASLQYYKWLLVKPV